MLSARQQVDANNLLQVLRQLPPDAVSHLLAHLGSNDLKNLKLASKELAGLVLSCRHAVNVVRQRSELPAPAELEKQVKVLGEYTFATQMNVIVHDAMDVTAALVGSADLGWRQEERVCRACIRVLPAWQAAKERVLETTSPAPCCAPAKEHMAYMRWPCMRSISQFNQPCATKDGGGDGTRCASCA